MNGAVALNLGANITGCLSVKINDEPKAVTFYNKHNLKAQTINFIKKIKKNLLFCNWIENIKSLTLSHFHFVFKIFFYEFTIFTARFYVNLFQMKDIYYIRCFMLSLLITTMNRIETESFPFEINRMRYQITLFLYWD